MSAAASVRPTPRHPATRASSPRSEGPRFGPEFNFTKTNNDYWDVLPRKISGMVEYWVIGYIERMSIGLTDPKTGRTIAQDKTDPLSYKQLAATAPRESGRTEPGCSLPAIFEAIKHALKAKLIGREKINREYRYWAIRENWAKAEDYQVPKEKLGKDKAKDITAQPVTSGSVPTGRRLPIHIPHPEKPLALEAKLSGLNYTLLEEAKRNVLRVEPIMQVIEFPAPPKSKAPETDSLNAYVRECLVSLPVNERVAMVAQELVWKDDSTLPGLRELALERLKAAESAYPGIAQAARDLLKTTKQQGETKASPPVEVPAPENDELYEAFRDMWKLAGREITVYKNRAVRQAFEFYDVKERRRILKDLAARFDGPWSKKLTVGASWYLESQLWRTEPIGERQIVSGNPKEEERARRTKRLTEFLQSRGSA